MSGRPKKDKPADAGFLKLKDRKFLERFFLMIARIAKFVSNVIVSAFSKPFEFAEVRKQIFLLGTNSVLMICFTSLIVGFVFTKQSIAPLVDLGGESFVPGLVAIAIIRSLGSLLVALIASGKIGANIGAELSAMRVTEQIDAMEVSGTKPFSYLVATRVIATALAMPVLVMYSDLLSLLGGFIAVNIYSETSLSLFFTQVLESLMMKDVVIPFIKPVFFGLAIGMVSSYNGYYSERATTGVGKAATSSVVISMVFIFIIDFLFLQILTLISV